MYLPAVGRWLSEDPAGYVDGPNQYLYVRNNPVGLSDPSGMQCPTNPTKVTGMLPTGGATDDTISVQIEKIGFTSGDCGQFDWRIWWHLKAPAGAGNAFIVQKISVALKLQDCDGNDIAAQKSPLVTNGGKRVTSITYWEEWGIAAGSNDTTARIKKSSPYDDQYVFPSIPCSRGQLKVKGEYTVIDGNPPIPPFKLRNRDTLAAGAPSSIVDPKVSPTPPIIWRRHDITVEWDCCC